jgi:carboxymethylenebutenolidase
MGQWTTLTAADGHTLSAWRTGPEDASQALVVLQEIFGVNSHVRDVSERFAAEGYLVLAPALFDRIRPGIELGYTAEDVAQGRTLRAEVSDAAALADIEAAAAALNGRALGVAGYCWGGTLAWFAATRTHRFRAASCWYGGGIAATRGETPHCPVQMHFGDQDTSIPLSDVEAIRGAHPEVDIYVYAGAQHGFGCDARASFSKPHADVAQQRTLAFLADKLGR